MGTSTTVVLVAIGVVAAGCYRSHERLGGPPHDGGGAIDGTTLPDAFAPPVETRCFRSETLLMMGEGSGCWSVEVTGGGSIECPSVAPSPPFQNHPVRLVMGDPDGPRPIVWVQAIGPTGECAPRDYACDSASLVIERDMNCTCDAHPFVSGLYNPSVEEQERYRIRPESEWPPEDAVDAYLFLSNDRMRYRVTACRDARP